MFSAFSLSTAKSLVLLLLLAVLPLTSACTLAKISGRGSIPLFLNNPPVRVDVISHFSENKTVTFDYTSSFDVSEVIAAKLSESDADAVTNLVVTVKSNFKSFLINVVTLGIAWARIVEVEGDLVKAPNGLGALPPDRVLARFDNLDQLQTQLNQYMGSGNALPTLMRLDGGYALVDTR